jgi:hypothetical protein
MTRPKSTASSGTSNDGTMNVSSSAERDQERDLRQEQHRELCRR